MNIIELEEYWAGEIRQLGAAHAVSGDPPAEDIGELLRKVAEEVTGKSIEPPVRPRIGFLP